MLTFHGLVLSVVEKALVQVGKLNERTVKTRRQSQVRFKEMSEMRANRRRGIVKNRVIAQNRRGRRPEGTSRMRKSWQDVDSAGNRCKDGMTLNQARLRNRGNSPKALKEKP